MRTPICAIIAFLLAGLPSVSDAAGLVRLSGAYPDGVYLVASDEGSNDGECVTLNDERLCLDGRHRVLLASHVESAQVSNDPQIPELIVIRMHFSSAAAEEFGDLTASNVGQRLALVIDGSVVTAPVVNEPIGGGELQISGGLTREQANAIVEGLLRDAVVHRP